MPEGGVTDVEEEVAEEEASQEEEPMEDEVAGAAAGLAALGHGVPVVQPAAAANRSCEWCQQAIGPALGEGECEGACGLCGTRFCAHVTCAATQQPTGIEKWRSAEVRQLVQSACKSCFAAIKPAMAVTLSERQASIGIKGRKEQLLGAQ